MKAEVKKIEQELRSYSDPVKREVLPRFFKTGKGEYGEGDKFLGVVVPNTRLVAKCHKNVPFDVLSDLLCSEWHECRLCALLILIEQFKKCDEKDKKQLFEFYMKQTVHINNWDLVDLSAPTIVGEYLLDKDREVLYKLAESSLLWEQRIAIVSTLTFIRNNDFIDIIRLSSNLICAYPFQMHDLLQKAIGWMLREMGKRNKNLLLQFLEEHIYQMPRTMLRYAIERFPEEERKAWLNK